MQNAPGKFWSFSLWYGNGDSLVVVSISQQNLMGKKRCTSA